ncbi:MAG: carbohydrate ABC transporter permease [Oscillospiraceae bacterium]|nr:carbohydrate ABC transporter permease [Oscillospiraceae bacterium]
MNNTGVKSREDWIYQIIINIFLIILALAAVMPFVMLVSSSLTDEFYLTRFGYNFWPTKFSTYAYTFIFSKNGTYILRAYWITLLVTVIGTSLHLIVAPLLAYPLSRRDYKKAHLFTFLVFFTMMFNGGIVPSYIMWSKVFHIKNTIWAHIFPGMLFNGFNIMLYKNYFANNIHPSLLESARIDGANEWQIYFKIVLPLSLPILATMGLMAGLGYWNNWTNGLYYVNDQSMYTLQQLLKGIIENIRVIADMAGGNFPVKDIPGNSVRMAMAVIGIIPIMILYPFFQNAFIAGISLGGVKE